MGMRNTVSSYGSVARWLHWTTALLFLGSYVSVYYRHWFTEAKTPENWTALQLHLSIGVTIAVVVTLRILWRINNRPPAPEPGTWLEHAAARCGHYALYAVMVIMPVTGYLGTGATIEYFFLFDISSFKDTAWFTSLAGDGLTFKQWEKPFDFVHKELLGELLLWMLIAGHAAAALWHHFGKKDRTLLRMTVGVQREKGEF